MYQRHLSALQRQGKSQKTIEAYSRAVRRITTHFDRCPDRLTRDDLEPFVTLDYRTARISVRHNVTDSVRLNAAVDEMLDLLPTVIGEDITVAFTGRNLMVNRAAESLMRS